MVTSDDWNRDASGRFGPGNKGGPGWEKGRPRLSLKTALERAIADSMREEDGRSILDALAATAIKAAAAGSSTASTDRSGSRSSRTRRSPSNASPAE